MNCTLHLQHSSTSGASASANLGVDKPPWNAEFCWTDASPQNEASLQHSSGQGSRSGAHRNLCCWRKASWRCTPSPKIPAAACHVGMSPDQLIGLSESHSIDFAQGASHQSSVGRRVAIDQPFRERGAPSTHNHHGPDLVSIHIHIFTTPAVRVQHEVTVHVIVKASVQLGHAVAHLEWVRPPGNEQALRIHMDRLLCQQQHISFLRAKLWPHRLIYPAASSTTAFRCESIRSRGADTRRMPIARKIHQTNRPTRTLRRTSG